MLTGAPGLERSSIGRVVLSIASGYGFESHRSRLRRIEVEKYFPNERIVKRAVALWKRMLSNPTYDALGTGPRSAGDQITMGIGAPALANLLPRNNTPEVLDRFGESLIGLLMTPHGEGGYYITSLGVDYGPDQTLSAAAEASGLKMEFPWKTYMYIEADYVSVCNGYGADAVYHYPLDSTRWLVCRLAGKDVGTVLDAVRSGSVDLPIENET